MFSAIIRQLKQFNLHLQKLQDDAHMYLKPNQLNPFLPI